jgi:formamidopyrimidine-DNA glycosylase
MPELPEVETIVRQLDGAIKGKKISKVEVLRDRMFVGNPDYLVGRKIEKVDRHAKMIVWHISGGDRVVMIHLKMTGQLIYDGKNSVGKENHTVVGGHPTEDWVKKHPTKHTRVIVHFDDGSVLYFNDMRMFGWMKLITKDEFDKQMAKLPPDVNTKEFSKDYFRGVVKKSGRAIKLTVMDSDKVGGAGNIYANDALWLAKIDPRRRSKDLSDAEIDRLHDALKEVIDKGIKYGGASAVNYVQITGVGGKYQDHFLVYNRDGQRCNRGDGVIQKTKIGGRGTFFCPHCQH